jgi:hypothetical protein
LSSWKAAILGFASKAWPDLRDHRWIVGVGRVAQVLRADLEQLARFGQQGDAPL